MTHLLVGRHGIQVFSALQYLPLQQPDSFFLKKNIQNVQKQIVR